MSRRWRTGCLSTAHAHNTRNATLVTLGAEWAERARIVQSTHLIDVGLTAHAFKARRTLTREGVDAVGTGAAVGAW
jgi:hypothetical protein